MDKTWSNLYVRLLNSRVILMIALRNNESSSTNGYVYTSTYTELMEYMY